MLEDAVQYMPFSGEQFIDPHLQLAWKLNLVPSVFSHGGGSVQELDSLSQRMLPGQNLVPHLHCTRFTFMPSVLSQSGTFLQRQGWPFVPQFLFLVYSFQYTLLPAGDAKHPFR